MVYYSGSKMARNAAKIVNRWTCGGPKKGGLAPSIGATMPSNPNLRGATQSMYMLSCKPNRTNTVTSWRVRPGISMG